MKTAKLALENGMVFSGLHLGAEGTVCGEAVFNTAMAGYQEVLTDPSYYGQIVTMTYPLIGNYGINAHDIEAPRTYLAGFVVKETPPSYSHHQAERALHQYLQQERVVGLSGVDTRAITRILRECGALRAALSSQKDSDEALIEKARHSPPMSGRNLVREVAGNASRSWTPAEPDDAGFRVAVLDCGVKYNILRHLENRGCQVSVVSGLAEAQDVLVDEPDGLLVGNGPGDPAVVEQTIATLRELVGRVPIMGICLGHQLLACALDAEIYKLKFGHHGVNHPVKRLATGQVEITSQNHGFAVEPDSLTRCGCVATHVNLNDASLEGFAHTSEPLFAVQYHPEAAPGPRESAYLFDLFSQMMTDKSVPEQLIPQD